jgi:phosphodiesterase/alkaline phosphatase D-like protein
MSLITSSNRIYVTDASGNVKFDTDRKYPFIIGTANGSVTVTNSIVTTSVTVSAGESWTTATAYQGSEIDSANILVSSAYPIQFCISRITLTGVSGGGVTPNNSYYYYRLPVNKAYSVNGSLLTELEVAQNGRVVRAAQVTIYANTSNQVVLHFKRTGSNNDQSTAASFTFNYSVQYGRII